MINTLVKHKTKKSLGIGCIAKELKSSYKVNFGTTAVITCKKELIEVIDTSQCKTVSYYEFSTRILRDKSQLNFVIVGNEIKEFVGIGWISLGVVTEKTLLKYPRVV
jgi:hypothetical protein